LAAEPLGLYQDRAGGEGLLRGPRARDEAPSGAGRDREHRDYQRSAEKGEYVTLFMEATVF